MATVKIDTLTPVHIGSGIALQGDMEYLVFPEEREIAVVDDQRILNLIGEAQINQWMDTIQQGNDLKAYLSRKKRDLIPDDVAKRLIQIEGTSPRANRELREQLHNGQGWPMIPGSSLKGAIRTAILAFVIENEGQKWVQDRANLVNRYNRFKDDKLIKQYFGKDPYQDIFRLLQVGDVHFNQTTCYLTQAINSTHRGWQFKDPINQFIEAIPDNLSSTFQLKFNHTLYKKAKKRTPRLYEGFHDRIRELDPISLFYNINDHFDILIDNEIKFWKKEGNPAILDNYLDELDRISSIINRCEEGECVLRLGYGTGAKNMTGDWQKQFMNHKDYLELVQSLRPKHSNKLPYPKTRRMVEAGFPLGYVKLKILA